MTISELYIYPIKSLGGIAVNEVVVEEKGLRYDRRFMLVTPAGEFLTQRANPQMALMDVAIEGDALQVWHRQRPDDVLMLPLMVSDPTESMLVTIWDSKDVPAVTVSPEADTWFTNVLGQPCRLVFMPETTHRAVDTEYALNDDAVSFADGYPYLLIGQSSLDYLNTRLATPMSMRRFRPNFIVNGSLPNEEDSWAEFRIGNLNFYGVKPCARCVLTTIDPETGEQGKEPLRTLATYRQWKHKLLFGQNMLVKSTGAAVVGTVRVGQSVEVIQYQEPWLAPPIDQTLL
ncbi:MULTISPECIES: MOSC N-terminal beta barrel domain-containing protein [unclassified Spirosoma]|uniref:MOSC domain-containing protein n=1 Tax=unclassified Spirosoma TaxID=2621999 RepID=UPI00095F2D75|nr:MULTISPECIES: MOSC N-terminal beta barrel domain-containing protein [unclassified Spirosoma]MBN8820539.1 MOSC domain-containing protein [Spirosoma sp.]OJW71328.1 MAG: MOSC domain-containing protein [Spirosoma sp. 48-14]